MIVFCIKNFRRALISVFCTGGMALGQAETGLQQLRYENSDLTVDLAVGLWAWPMPMDYDDDGDFDLLVSCPDVPSNGTYLFENPGGFGAMPVFMPGVRLGKGHRSIRVSRVSRKDRILIPAREFVDFRKKGFTDSVSIFPKENIHSKNIRNNQWSLLDYDGDERIDLVIGVGDWTEYGWDNAYNARGEWLNGPLHGYVYWLRNTGSNAKPVYSPKQFVVADGSPVDVYGLPTPNFADFDADGDLDLVCGEFLDRLTYFQNAGSRTEPSYLAGQRLRHAEGELKMDLQMILPSAIDWDGDGDVDLIVGQEDGRVAFVEHTGRLVDGVPLFAEPKFFQQKAVGVKFGALSTPVAVDWDGDGDADIVSGNTAGYIGFFENLGGGARPRWATGRLLKADGEVIRIQAGENGSIQGPCEAKWGYTTLSVADWDHDGLSDILVNSIWGEVLWYRNVGSRTQPRLTVAGPVEVAWLSSPPKPKWCWWNPRGDQLVSQWRTTPVAVDFTGDGLNDLVMLDYEGYLSLFERRRARGKLELLPPRRLFVDEDNQPIQLNPGFAGKSGRRKIAVADWDGDGRLDVLVDSINADWWRNCETRDGKIVLKRVGPLGQRNLSSHSTSPCVVDWDGNGKPDLLLGAEDGFFYHLPHEEAIAYPASAKIARPARKSK